MAKTVLTGAGATTGAADDAATVESQTQAADLDAQAENQTEQIEGDATDTDTQQVDAAAGGEDVEVVDEIDYDDLQKLKTEAAQAKKLQQQLAKAQKDLKAAGDKVSAYERAKMSEQEKLQADAKAASERAAKLEADLRLARSRLAIAETARELKVKPSLAEKLVGAAVEFDDNGNPTNVRELLDAQIEETPEIVQRAAAVVAATPQNADAGRRDRKPIVMDDLASMTTDQINDLWAKGEIQNVLTGQRARA